MVLSPAPDRTTAAIVLARAGGGARTAELTFPGSHHDICAGPSVEL